MKKENWVLFPFLPMDYKAAEVWLNQKAAQGWQYANETTLWGYLICLRRTERTDLRYCVDISGGTADQDYRDFLEQAGWVWEGTVRCMDLFSSLPGTERTDLRYCVDISGGTADQDYRDFLEQAGWVWEGTVRCMDLFSSLPDAAPVPIQTDADLERQRFGRRYFWRTWLTNLAVSLAAVALLVWLFGYQMPPHRPPPLFPLPALLLVGALPPADLADESGRLSGGCGPAGLAFRLSDAPPPTSPSFSSPCSPPGGGSSA